MSFEIRDIRNQYRRLREELDRLQPSISDDHGDFVTTTLANGMTYPTTTGVYYWVRPQTIAGNEIAGVTATLADDGVTVAILALSLGPNPPIVGKPFVVSTTPDGHHVFHS